MDSAGVAQRMQQQTQCINENVAASYLFADSAYAGPVFHDGLANIMPNLVTEIVSVHFPIGRRA